MTRTIDGQLIDTDAREWAAVLESTPHDFYHLPEYVAMCAAQQGGRACAVHVAEGDRALLLPLIVRDIDGDGVDAISPYGYPGPLINDADPDFALRATVVARSVLEQAGVVSVFVRHHPLLNQAPVDGLGALVHHGDTVSIDLTRPAADLWGQLRSNHRRDINRARSLGFSVRVDDDWDHLDGFARIYRGTMERIGAAPFYFFDDAYFSDLRNALGDRLHLFVVERDGTLVAGSLFVATGSIFEYHLSGIDAGSLNWHPGKLLTYHASLWAKERGLEVLHLGGGVGGVEDSLFHFKLGFSPRRHPFSTSRLVVDEVAYRRLTLANDPSSDPDDRSGFFPAYRRG